MRFENPSQLEVAEHPDDVGAIGDVVLEVGDDPRAEYQELDGEIVGSTGFLGFEDRILGLDVKVAKDFGLPNTGNTGAVSPIFADASQLQAIASLDE